MAANALDQITTATVAAPSVMASRRSMAESITAPSADLAGDETQRRHDSAGDTGRREAERARTGAGRARGGRRLRIFGPVERTREVAVQKQHLAGDVVN